MLRRNGGKKVFCFTSLCKKILFALLFGFPLMASAAPSSLSYQGRILKADGTPLEYSAVQFDFKIMDPSGQYMIYEELSSSIDMSHSGGMFDVPIGKGTKTYPDVTTLNTSYNTNLTLLDTFNNNGHFYCKGAGANASCYSPLANDTRILRVSFNDGTGWKEISPDSVIRSVPFAGYSLSAQRLGTNVATDFVLKTDVNGGLSCNANEFLTWNALSQSLVCSSVPGASGGTVTAVTAASPLAVTNGTSSPNITIQAANASQNGYLSSTDWIAFNNKLGSSSTFTGDVSGTSSTTSVDKIKGVTVSATAPTSNQVLTYTGGAWTPANLPSGNLSGSGTAGYVSYYSAATTLADSNIYYSGGKIGIGTTNPGSTNRFHAVASCGGGIGIYDSTLSFSSPACTSILGDDGGSGPTIGVMGKDSSSAGIGVMGYNAGSGFGGLFSSASGPALITGRGNVGIGTTSPATKLEVNGTVKATAFQGDGSGLTGISTTPAGTGGANFMSIQYNDNGVMGATNQFSWDKMNYRLNMGNDASATTTGIFFRLTGAVLGTNISAYSGGKLGLTTNSAERLTIDTNGYVGIGTTSPNTKLDIRGTSGATLKIVDGNQGAGKVLTSDANGVASWSSASGAVTSVASKTGAVTLDVGDIGSASSKYFTYKPNNTSCTSGQTLSWDSGNSRWICGTAGGSPGGSSSQVQFNNSGAFAGSANLVWDNTNGRLGIGTASPAAALHVVGDIQYTGVLTDISDRRLKKNIVPMYSALDTVRNIKTYSYVLKNDPRNQTEYGVIAQEMQQLIPNLVKYIDADKKYIGVNYVGLIPWSIRAIQEVDSHQQNLKMENDKLKERVEELEAKNKKLEIQLARILERLQMEP